jgi:transposase
LWRVTFVLFGGKDVTPRWLQPANKSLRPRLSFARLLRGEPRGPVARTNVSIARLTEWRERALAGAATALKERECDDRNDEIARLKSKVGEITMDNEPLYAKIAALEGKRPLAHRRSRR